MIFGPEDITGKGLIFPLELTSKGKVVVRGGFDLIQSSLRQIMAWYIGTRYFLGEFGTPIARLLEEPNDDIAISLLEYQLTDRIPLWDNRFTIKDVVSTRVSQERLNVRIIIGLNNTNITEQFNYTFNNGTLE